MMVNKKTDGFLELTQLKLKTAEYTVKGLHVVLI